MASVNIRHNLFVVAGEKNTMMEMQLATTLVLARLCASENFRLIGMLGIFIALDNMFVNRSFDGSLIYYKDVRDEDFAIVFWFNLRSISRSMPPCASPHPP